MFSSARSSSMFLIRTERSTTSRSMEFEYQLKESKEEEGAVRGEKRTDIHHLSVRGFQSNLRSHFDAKFRVLGWLYAI